MEKKGQLQNYISTPFAYTKFYKNLTLLQQSILNKVSEHLQEYVKKYYGSELCKSRVIPRSLFSVAEKNNGIPDFQVLYAELGVSINNYPIANAAVKDILDLTVDAPGFDKDGNPAIVKYNIFTKANMSSEEKNGITFSLNKEVVDYVFDMSQGYVSHPANIAQIGRVERMPMIYYLLFKKSEKWRNRIVYLTVMEIKEYLGMYAKSNDVTMQKTEMYPRFSKFKQKVIETSINDINRLKKDNLIDICLSYECIYTGKRKVGNPNYIAFHIYDNLRDLFKENKEAAGLDISSMQDKEEINKKVYTDEYIQEWNKVLADYVGEMSEVIKRGIPYGKNENGWLEVAFSKDDADKLNGSNEWMRVCEAFKNVVGIKHGPGVQMNVTK